MKLIEEAVRSWWESLSAEERCRRWNVSLVVIGDRNFPGTCFVDSLEVSESQDMLKKPEWIINRDVCG